MGLTIPMVGHHVAFLVLMSSNPSASPTTATLGGRYQLMAELGRGGMAVVHRARDLRHGRDVAVKIMRPNVAAEIGADRFLREIEISARLQHPHIVPIFDSGETGGQLFFVMPLLEGESLRSRLDREGKLAVDESLRLIREVADALDYAHGQGILHRDLKPENIMLNRGHALLADFGIARAASDTRLTQTGTAIGTPAYMSPEQATGEHELGPPSDVYSLGSMLFEMLTGEPPFTGPTFEAILIKRFTQDAPRCMSRRADTPASCDAAVAQALARDPAHRFPTARAFAEALTTAPTPGTVAIPTQPKARSIVVLPFVNQSPEAENEYFSDGLTEEIITDLSRVKALSVVSRTSSMQLKGTAKPVRTLAQELQVRYALAGSVRRAGTSLRITAELVDTATDTPVWAEKFSGTVEDVFDVQERVSREIVRALNVTLSSAEDRGLASRPIADVRAFELYLQARAALRAYQLDRGNALIGQAIAIEGPVPVLRTLRAQALILLVRMGLSPDARPLEEARREAHALIEEAPDAPYGYALLGYIGYERGTLRDGVRAFQEALERDPSDVDAHFYLGVSLIGAGQTEAAARLCDRLRMIDPLSSMTAMLSGVIPWFEGRPAEGVAAQERAVQIEPEGLIHHWTLGYVYALTGQVDRAAGQAEWLQRNGPPGLPYTLQLLSLVASLRGNLSEAGSYLASVRLNQAIDGHTRFHLGEAFAMAGDSKRALELFRDAVESNFYPHQFIARYDPFVEPVKHTPEFAEVLAIAERRVAEFSIH